MHRAILFFIIFTSAWPLTLSAFTEQLNRQRRYCELVVMTGIGARLQDRAKVQNQDLNRLLNAARNTIQNRARTVTSALSSVDRQALTTAISSCKTFLDAFYTLHSTMTLATMNLNNLATLSKQSQGLGQKLGVMQQLYEQQGSSIANYQDLQSYDQRNQNNNRSGGQDYDDGDQDYDDDDY